MNVALHSQQINATQVNDLENSLFEHFVTVASWC